MQITWICVNKRLQFKFMYQEHSVVSHNELQLSSYYYSLERCRVQETWNVLWLTISEIPCIHCKKEKGYYSNRESFSVFFQKPLKSLSNSSRSWQGHYINSSYMQWYFEFFSSLKLFIPICKYAMKSKVFFYNHNALLLDNQASSIEK